MPQYFTLNSVKDTKVFLKKGVLHFEEKLVNAINTIHNFY